MNQRKTSEILLVNANILTMNGKMPKAGALLISEGHIRNLWKEKEPLKREREGRVVVDLKGKTVLPGFIDPHLHFKSYVESFLSLDLSKSKVRSIEDIKKEIYKATKKKSKGEWIKGRGYDEFYLAEKRHPTRFDLDLVSPYNPVKLSHRTGQIHVLNSLALKLLDITDESEDPEYGMIDRDLDTGKPTGILYGMGKILSEKIPKPKEKEWESALKKANEALIRSGIVSFMDASHYNDVKEVKEFREWKEKGLISVNASLLIGFQAFERIEGIEEYLSPGVKILIHEIKGRPCPEKKSLEEYVRRIHSKGLQVAIHAIEEEHVEMAVFAIEEALKRVPKTHRHRIEHCSLCPPPLIDRMASLGINVVSQPSFIYFNGERYLKTIEEGRINYLYPFKSLLRKGICLSSASDAPIVPLNPMISLYAACTRMTESGEVLNEKEVVSLDEALKMHTLLAAQAIFEEKIRGSIDKGKIADLIVFNEDIERAGIQDLKEVDVVMTIIEGKVLWDAIT